jgi:hypothetical protein
VQGDDTLDRGKFVHPAATSAQAAPAAATFTGSGAASCEFTTPATRVSGAVRRSTTFTRRSSSPESRQKSAGKPKPRHKLRTKIRRVGNRESQKPIAFNVLSEDVQAVFPVSILNKPCWFADAYLQSGHES